MSAKQPYFQGKIVVVVGATGGLGAAIVRAVAERGAIVIAAGRDRTKLDRLAAERHAVAAISIDTTRPDDHVALSEYMAAHYDHIDVVINATGLDVRQPLDAHTTSDVQRMIAVNLGGAIQLTQTLLPIMGATGVIVHVGGFADGRLAFPYHSVDVATRAGVFSFVESINRELGLAPRDVIVSYFSPSPTDTEAERPYHPIWRELGVKIEPIERVVAELLTTIERRQRVHIMGGFTIRLFAGLNAVWPPLADRLVMKRFGRILKRQLIDQDNQPRQTSTRSRQLGIALIITSFVLYGGLLAVPFLPLDTAIKLAVSPVLIALGEVTFWVGGALVGKELIARYRRYLNPCAWCRIDHSSH